MKNGEDCQNWAALLWKDLKLEDQNYSTRSQIENDMFSGTDEQI